MKNVRILTALCLVTLLALISCSMNSKTSPATLPGEPSGGSSSQDVNNLENLALGKETTSSASGVDGPAENAVDGVLETQWNSGSGPEQWIQIDLGAAATVSGIRLTVAQYPEGDTSHQILVGGHPISLRLAHEITGRTKDGQVLEYVPEVPMTNVQYIKISTKTSPSWVAWREVEIFGQFDAIQPAVTKAAESSRAEAADVIYFNGQIITMEESRPLAQAIALKGGKIIAVGEDAEVMLVKEAATKLVDLKGLTLTPGFIDSHAHRIGDRWHYGDVSAEAMMAEALSQGWTAVHELFVFDQRLNELVDIARAGTMPIRVSMYLTMNFDYSYDKWWQAYRPLQQYGPYLQIAGLKITLDREWGEQVFFSQEQFTHMVMDAVEDGWQVATHSFSPKANQIVLNGYEAGLNGQPNTSLRLRLEHIGTMTDDQLIRMSDLGIIGSVGLINAGSLPDDASFKKFIPAEEVEHTARWRDLINGNVFLTGNTDAPWCCTDWRNNFNSPSHDATVVQAIYQGVTRRTFEGRPPEPWQIAQVLTVHEALEMLTINGAYAGNQEDQIGSLKPGKLADLVILSANPLTIPTEQIPNISVVMTMVGGDVKYCAAGRIDICEKSAAP